MDPPEAERIAPVSARGGIAVCSPESPARAPRASPTMGSPSSPLAKQGPASAHGSIRIALVDRFLPDSSAGSHLLSDPRPSGVRPPPCPGRIESSRLVQYQQQQREPPDSRTGRTQGRDRKGRSAQHESLHVARTEKEVDDSFLYFSTLTCNDASVCQTM